MSRLQKAQCCDWQGQIINTVNGRVPRVMSWRMHTFNVEQQLSILERRVQWLGRSQNDIPIAPWAVQISKNGVESEKRSKNVQSRAGQYRVDSYLVLWATLPEWYLHLSSPVEEHLGHLWTVLHFHTSHCVTENEHRSLFEGWTEDYNITASYKQNPR